MGLIAKTTGGSDMTPAPEGTHLARCVQVVDKGTQVSDFYKKAYHKVMIGWELPEELNPDDENLPYLVWGHYTVSLSDNANLRHMLESWRGKRFTAEELDGFNLRNIRDNL